MQQPIPYGDDFSEDGFWKKLGRFALKAGCEVVEKALLLYYVYNKPGVPPHHKAVITGALAYFILPTDAMPDFLIGVGFLDDLGVLAWALMTVAMHIDDDVRAQARRKLLEWFPNGCARDPQEDAA